MTTTSELVEKLHPMTIAERYPMSTKAAQRRVYFSTNFILTKGGRVAYISNDITKEEDFPKDYAEIKNWKGVVALESVGDNTLIMGLKAKGTCYVCKVNPLVPSDTVDELKSWTDIVQIRSTSFYEQVGGRYFLIIGLKADGSCVATFFRYYNHPNNKTDTIVEQFIKQVKSWNGVIYLSNFIGMTIVKSNNSNIYNVYLLLSALKSNGTLVHACYSLEDNSLSDFVTIKNSLDKTANILKVYYTTYSEPSYDISWKLAVCVLKTDGTVEFFQSRKATWWEIKAVSEEEGTPTENVVDLHLQEGYILNSLKKDGSCYCRRFGYSPDGGRAYVGNDHRGTNVCIAIGNTYALGKDGYYSTESHLSFTRSKGNIRYDWSYTNDGILKSKQPINTLDKSNVLGFDFKGIEPENTMRKVVFKVDGTWNKLIINEGTATMQALKTQEITAESVLNEGNSISELTSVTSIPEFAGKLIYPAVALRDDGAEVMPTFGMTVKAEIDTTVNVYSFTGYSQEYSLSAGEDVQVVNVVAETETTGEGNVVVTARLKQGGKWTDYMALSDTAMKQASALQLKAVYTVTNTDGSQSAKVKNVTIRYTTSGATVNGVSTDIVTKTQRFTNDLVYAHCYVKHKKLQDAVIDAYCSLRKRPKSKSLYQFGNGTGVLNTYKLPDAGINQDTLSVYVDGKAVYDFGYNTETSEITLTADKDTALSASYEYGWEMSEWIKMVQGVSQVNDSGGYTTEYSYTVPTHEGYEYTVTAIKYSLVRPEGTITEETIGVGTGKRQMIELPHFAKKETIVCDGAWSYDYDRRLLTIIAPEGEDIVISYDWIAETPKVYAISAGWAD